MRLTSEPGPLQAFAERVASNVCLAVAELPDRSSPDDQPEMMLVTQTELSDLIGTAIEECCPLINTERVMALELALQNYMDAVRYADKESLMSAIKLADIEALKLVPRRLLVTTAATDRGEQ